MNTNSNISPNGKAGAITFALGLIILGAVLLTANFMGQGILVSSIKLWPVLLIGLGMEYFIRRYINSKANPEAETKFHIPALISILIISLTAYSVQQVISVINLPDINNLINETISGTNYTYNRTYTKDITLRPGIARLVLSDLDCKVDLVPSNDEQIHIKANIDAWGPSESEAKRRAEMVKLHVDEGDIINVSLLEAQQDNLRRRPQITVRIMVPKGVEISLDKINGQLRADSLQNNVEISGQSGRFNLNRIQGNIMANVSNGEVLLNNIAGNIKVEAESGEIKITNPQKDVTVKNSSGVITMNINPSLNAAIDAVVDVGEISGSLEGLEINQIQENGPGRKAKAVMGTGQSKISLYNNNGQIFINQN